MQLTSALPLVSIFIPAFNAEASIQQSINSVLRQSYKQYELIIINDASTDRTAELIEGYRDHPQVKIYHNSTNLGVGRNWNLGISLCQGDFIVRLDADDFYTPTYLEEVMAVFNTQPEVDMVFTAVNLLYTHGEMTLFPYRESWVSYGQDFLPDLLRVCHVRSPSACVKRSCYERSGPIIETMDIHEDWEMWVRITTTGYVGYVAKPLANIRMLNTNGCTNRAIIQARSPVSCAIWLDYLTQERLPYQLTPQQLTWLKQGMYNQIMAFAVIAMENGLSESVEKHLAFARAILPAGTRGSMQARLYARAAEIYFMNGGHHLKGWQFLLKSLRLGWLTVEQNRKLKLWARAIFGKEIFEFVRKHTVVRWKFPYIRNHQT